MRPPVLRLLGCPMVLGAHGGNSPWSVPLTGLSVALSHRATWVGSEIFPGCMRPKAEAGAEGSLLPPSAPPPPSCCESGSSREGPGSFPSQAGCCEQLGTQAPLWKDTRALEGQKGKQPSLYGYCFDFNRTVCCRKNRSKGAEADLSP